MATQIRITILNGFRHIWNNKNILLSKGSPYYLDIDKVDDRKELFYMLSGQFPYRHFIALEYTNALLELFNISKLDVYSTHPADPEQARIYYNAALGKVFIWTGSAWMDISSGGGGGSGGGGTGITVIPQLFGDVTSSGFSNEVSISPGVIVDADISPAAGIKLSKLELNPLNRANHIGVQAASTIVDFDAQVRTNRLDQFLPPAMNISMAGNRILDVGAPVSATDAVNLGTLNSSVANLRLNDIKPPIADYSMAGYKLTNLGTPINSKDAVTKEYVDTLLALAATKPPVRLIALTNVSPMSGTGQLIDGRVVVAGDSIALNGQTDPRLNGIWVASAGAWTRRPDADSNTELVTGTQFFVTDGSLAGSGWVMTQPNGPTVLGTSQIKFTQYTGLGMVSAGDGLISNATGIHAVGTANRIVTYPDSIDISPNYAGQTSITTLGPVTTGTWMASPVNVQYGGTGASNAADARANLGAAKSGVNSDITALTGLTTPIAISQGGTGATTAVDARTNLQAAKSGVNSDITQLTGLTVPLSVSQGGTGANTADGARVNLVAAKSGVNSDITQLTALAVPISVTQGGTGSNTASGARVNLGAVGNGVNLGLGAGSTVGQIFHSVTNTGSDIVMNFRSLVEGPGINITQNTDDITIAIDPASLPSVGIIDLATGTSGILPLSKGGTGVNATSNGNLLQLLGAVATASSLGGASLLGLPSVTTITNVGNQLNFKGLTGANGITLTPSASTVDIAVNAVNVGSGRRVLQTPISGAMALRSLVPVSGIQIVETTTEIQFTVTPPTGSNLGAGRQVLVTPVTPGAFTFRTLLEAPGITITQGANDITFAPHIASAANVGTGKFVLQEPIVTPGATLNFKSFVGMGIVVDDTVPTELHLSANIGSITNVGAGAQVLLPYVTPNAALELRSILSGNGILVTQEATDIKVDLNAANLGAGAQVLQSPVGAIANFRSILQGAGVVVTQNANDISIAANLAGAANVGAGRQMLVTPLTTPGATLNFRTLTEGVGINLTQSATEVLVDIDATNLGTGKQSLVTPLGSTLSFRSLVEGTGITMVQTATDITVTPTVANAANLGAGAFVLANPPSAPGTTINFRSIVGFYGINTTQNANDVQLDIHAANLGSGREIFKPNLAPTATSPLEFRTLVQGVGVTLVQTANDITVNANLAGATNLGAGTPVLVTPLAPVPGSVLNFKTFVAGQGITLTPTADDITIVANSVNVGGGQQVLKLPSGTTANEFRTLRAATTNPGITLTTVGDEVIFQSNIASAANVGAGAFILQTPLVTPGATLNMRSIVSGNGITAVQNATDITLNLNANNVGTGSPVLVTPLGATADFRSIIAGKGLLATSTATDITLDVETENLGTTGGQVLFNPGTGAVGDKLQFRRIDSADASVIVTETATTVDLQVVAAIKALNTTANIPDGTPVTITHNLNSTEVMVQIWEDAGGGKETLLSAYDIQNKTANSLEVVFAPSAAPGPARLVIIGIQ